MKPCPFCGITLEEPYKFMVGDDDNHIETIAIICEGCEAVGPFAYNSYSAILLWSTRPTLLPTGDT